MKVYKKDRRFAIKEFENGFVGVFVRDYDGKYKLNYQLVDLEAAYQCIYSLADSKEYVTQEDFEEI